MIDFAIIFIFLNAGYNAAKMNKNFMPISARALINKH